MTVCKTDKDKDGISVHFAGALSGTGATGNSGTDGAGATGHSETDVARATGDSGTDGARATGDSGTDVAVNVDTP